MIVKPSVIALVTGASLLGLTACGGKVEEFTLTDNRLSELSGLAASKAQPGLLWAHNDSGDAPALYRLQDGKLTSRVLLTGAAAIDWEDMASFFWQGKPALLIGDMGDNDSQRDHITLYAYTDPGSSGIPEKLWELNVRYPDGAKDAESLAVVGDTAYLLTKRQDPPQLYRVSLGPNAKGAVAELLGSVRNLPRPDNGDILDDPLFGRIRHWPTGMDINDQGVVVLTYKDAYWYPRKNAQTPVYQALMQKPKVLDLPQLPQTEAVAIDGKSLWAGSEKLPTRLVKVSLP
jgi:hypothetical protein